MAGPAICAIVAPVHDMNASPRTANPPGHTLAGLGLAAGEHHAKPKRQEWLLLTAILLLGALLRLGWPGIVQFGLDEAQTMGLALDLVQGRGLPLFGTGTSFGLPTSPVSEYVYVPAALLWDDPLWLTWFTAALNVVALVPFWRLCRRYWGPRVALCATLLFATHPWAVISSRKIWEPNLIAFFAIPWAITGELAFHERQPKALVAHLALLSIAAVFGVLARRVPHRILDGGRLALFPGEPTTLLLTPGADTALQACSKTGLLDLAEVIPNRRGEEPFRILRLDGGLAPELRSAAEPRHLAHGAEIVGYRMDGELKPRQAIDWWIAWRVQSKAANPQNRYHIFNRLVDAAGTYVTHADGPTIPARSWVVGDLVVQHFRMKLPAQVSPGPLWMRVGMYTYPEMQNQPVLDANGQPAGEFVVLGPLSGD